MSILAQIYRHRALTHARDTGSSLDIADVLCLEELDAALRTHPDFGVGAEVTAILTLGDLDHRVRLDRIGPDGAVCADGPLAYPGTTGRLSVHDPHQNHTYQFRVVVVSARASGIGGGCELGLQFLGPPVWLRWGPGRSRSSDAVIELENTLRAA